MFWLKKIRIVWLALWLSGLLPSLVLAQSPSPISLAEGETLFRQLCQKARQVPKADQVMHITYQAVSYFRVAAKAPLQQSASELEVYIGPGKVFYTGKEVTCVQDGKQLISVFPQSKRILVSKSDPKRLQADVSQQWKQLLQDTLLRAAPLTAVVRETLGGKPVVKLVLSVLASYQSRMGMNQLSVWMDPLTQLTRQIEVRYLTGSAMEKAILSFSEPQWQPLTATPVPASAAALIWDNQGNVRSLWQDYEIVQVKQ